MNKIQEQIAIEVINLYWYGMQGNPTGFTFQDIRYSVLRLPNVTKEEYTYNLPIVKDELLRMKILKSSIGYGETYQLTNEGRLFSSFSQIEKEERKEVRSNYWRDLPKKYAIPFTIAGFIIGSILTPIAIEIWKTKHQKLTPSSNIEMTKKDSLK